MNEHIFNFIVVSVIQFIFLSIHYYFAKGSKLSIKHLCGALLIGLAVGLATDLIWGKHFGLFTYYLGFEPSFLFLNAALSYGLWIANVFLLHNQSLEHVIIWSLLLGFVYEAANFFYPVWQWTFASPITEYLVVTILASIVFTWLMMLTLRILYKIRFKLIPF